MDVWCFKHQKGMNYKSAKLNDANGDLGHRWFVFYYFRDPDTGKWVRFRTWISAQLITRSLRYDRAKEIQKEINIKLLQGWNPFGKQNRGLTCIVQCLDKFLEAKERVVRERTIISYRSYINHFKKWLELKRYDQLAVESFSYYMAGEYMDSLGSVKPIANRTWNNILQGLRCCFTFLVEKEYIIINPFCKIKSLQEVQAEINAFNKDELDILREKLPTYNHDLYVIALLIFNCFLRPQEIVRLQVHHLKESINGQLRIPGSVSKNKKSETIAITPHLQIEFNKLNLEYPGDYYIFGLHMKRNEKMAAPTRIAECWRKFAKEFGIKKNIYALKHTGNGMALENGANIRDLQLQNRHSSLDQTQRYLDRFSRTVSEKFINSFPKL